MEKTVRGSVQNLAFVGGGAMAEAIIRGILGKGLLQPQQITVGERTAERCLYLEKSCGVRAMIDNAAAVADADVIILAVKPQAAPEALTEELAAAVPRNACIVSIMGSVSLAQLDQYFPDHSVIRTMPNTPIAVGEGVTAIACGKDVSVEQLRQAEAIFSCCGITEMVSEAQLDAITAISGCGPGYAFVIIDALADAGVRAGLSRQLAIKLAAQTLAGSGKLCIESGVHPAELRDRVASPGGTTIAGIHALEKHCIRGAFFEAVQAVLKRNRELQGE